MKCILPLLLFICLTLQSHAQSIGIEKIDVEIASQPKVPTDPQSRFYQVKVNSSYNLSAGDVSREAKSAHDKALKHYDQVVAQSEKDYDKKLKSYDEDVQKAKDKFAIEDAAFKKKSLLERLAATDQGKTPKLVIPTKPEYYKPAPPVYKEPDLKDYFIAAVHFQDNAGQTFANQPTKLLVKVNGIENTNLLLFDKFEFVSSSPTDNINKPREEKNYLNKVIAYINKYLNEQYGYQAVKETMKIEFVKNKGDYDDLEKAHIYVTTNLKKLSSSSDPVIRDAALTNMQKGLDIWGQSLTKVDYKNSKSLFNAKIARFIYFNLMRVNLVLNKKKDAEKSLNELQEHLVDIDLSSGEKEELNQLEKRIYKK